LERQRLERKRLACKRLATEDGCAPVRSKILDYRKS